MSSICHNCRTSVPAHEQLYQLGQMIVCAGCAGVSPASLELAAAAARSRTGSVPKKRRAGMGLGAFAFASIMLGLAGGVGYLVYSGKLASTVVEHRDAINGTATINAVVDRYNTLLSQANALATDRKYAEAAARFRDARSVASAVPQLQKEVDSSQLDSVIAHYEALAAGQVPGSVKVRTVQVHAPRPPLSTEATITESPRPAHEPDIGFMSKGVVVPEETATTPTHKPGAEVDAPERDKPRRTRVDAYTVRE